MTAIYMCACTLLPSLMFIQWVGIKADVSHSPEPQKLTETSSWRGRNDNGWKVLEEEEGVPDISPGFSIPLSGVEEDHRYGEMTLHITK